MAGTYAAVTGALTPPAERWAVAARDLPPGHRIGPGDLSLAIADLPDEIAGQSFRAPESLLGAIVLGPLSQGALVQAGGLVRAGGVAGGREVSFPVASNLSLAGSLRVGERVDVVATLGSGDDASTDFVVRDVPVVAISTGDGSLGAQTTVITVALSNDADVLALAHAAGNGELVVVRSTDRSESPTSPTPEDQTAP